MTIFFSHVKVMVTQYIERKLVEKSRSHIAKLKMLGQSTEDHPLSERVIVLEETAQLKAINTIIQDNLTSIEEFIFYFDRITTLLIERFVPSPMPLHFCC